MTDTLKQFDRKLIRREISDIDAGPGDLSGRVIFDSQISRLTLTDGNLNYLNAADSKLISFQLDHCQSRQGKFVNCDIEKLRTQSCFLTSSGFTACRCREWVSELSSLDMTAWVDCNLVGSRMSEVTFIGSIWRNCRLDNEQYNFVRFPGSIFVQTEFKDCILRKAIFRRAVFIDCKFINCQIPEAVFQNAQLSNTTFENTDTNKAANLDWKIIDP